MPGTMRQLDMFGGEGYLLSTPQPTPVLSVVTGGNAELIAEVARLYLTENAVIADATFGMGAFWTKTDLSPHTFLASDIEPTKAEEFTAKNLPGTFVAADFAALPYPNESLDVFVLDPPYIHSPGNHVTDKRFNNAATTKGMDHDDIMELYRKGMAEGMRTLRKNGTLWVKCKDQVMSGKQCWSHIDLFQLAQGMGLYMRDLFVLVPSSRTSTERWEVQHHARKIHSYLLIFQK